MNIALYTLIALIIALNVKASLLLARSVEYDRRQKSLQYMIIWLFPAAGAVLVCSLVVNRNKGEDHLALYDRWGGDRSLRYGSPAAQRANFKR